MQARLAAVLVALALLTGSPRSEEAPATLHNEDIVRMLVAGTSANAVVRAIETRPVDFDLSPEMIDELRNAGIPHVVLDAMKKRVAAIEKKAEKEKKAAAIEAGVESETAGQKIRLHFGKATSVVLTDWTTDGLAARIGTPRTNESREIRDIAVFLACVTPEHAPEQWRSKTPLGRDFAATPKHHILFFQPGAAHLGAADIPDAPPENARRMRADGTPAGYFELQLPPEIAIDILQAEPHELFFGVAVEIQGIWHPVTAARKKAVDVGPAGVDFDAAIEAKGKMFDDVAIRITEKAILAPTVLPKP